MSPLDGLIRDEIARRGPISVARYMELALTHPEHGYYSTRDPLGAAGDFTTAPEISQMFGELIGLWVAVTWERMGKPTPFVLAELGPGRGTLMADALRAAHAQKGFIEAAAVHLVETSPALRARQHETLQDFTPQWHDDVATLPDGPLIVIANEFFDALPVRQFVHSGAAWRERLVEATAAGFRFTLAEAPDDGQMEDADMPDQIPEGAVKEISPAGLELAATLGARLGTNGGANNGAVLIIDYGYGHPAFGETLQAVKAHQPADPLAEPGEADITAHVDFTALARAARDAGAASFGPLGQGHFLLALGIAQRAERLSSSKDKATRESTEAALRRLIAPSEMGTLFKVLALTDPRLGPPPGFG